MRFPIAVFFSFILLASNSKANDAVEQPNSIILSLSKDNFLNQKSFVFDTIRLERITQTDNDFFLELEYDSVSTRVVKLKRGKAIIFTVLTGFLGGHRIYFGTHHRTPIIYSITFGGLGILPLIDLIHIIFTKDLSRYEHKSQIIMWGK